MEHSEKLLLSSSTAPGDAQSTAREMRDRERCVEVSGSEYRFFARHSEVIEFLFDSSTSGDEQDRAGILLTKVSEEVVQGPQVARRTNPVMEIATPGTSPEALSSPTMIEGAHATAHTDTYRVTARVLFYHRPSRKVLYESPLSSQAWTRDVHVDVIKQIIHFGKDADILLPVKELRGGGLGSYIMSDLIAFVKERYPGFMVSGLRLSAVDAATPALRDRRNMFYRRLGFTILPHENAEEGTAVATSVNHLTLNRWCTRIVPLELSDLLKATAADAKVARDEVRTLQDRVRNHEARATFDRKARLRTVAVTAIAILMPLLWALIAGWLRVGQVPRMRP